MQKNNQTNNAKIFFTAIVFLSLFLISGCKTTEKLVPQQEVEITSYLSDSWENLDNGLFFIENKKLPHNAHFQLAKINLENPELSIFFNEITGKMQKTIFVKKFHKQTGALISANTTPFYFKYKLPMAKAKPCGIIIIDKKIITPENKNYAGIAFFKEDGWRAKIYNSQTDLIKEPEIPDFACGGFWITLNNNTIYEFRDIKDYRTAMAVSNNGKTLFVMAAKNMSYMDCSRIFQYYGAEKALQLDGGSSSKVVVKNKKSIPNPIFRNVPAAIGIGLIR